MQTLPRLAVGFVSISLVAFTQSARAEEAAPPVASASAPAASASERPDNARVRWDLVGGGAAMFLGSYAAAATFGVLLTEPCANADGGPRPAGDSGCGSRPYLRLVIPVAGPFTYLGGPLSPMGKAIFVADGVLQLAGVAVAVVGALARTPSVESRGARATWTPVVGDRSVGVAGTF